MVIRHSSCKDFPITIGVKNDSGTQLFFHSFEVPTPIRGHYATELEYCQAYVGHSKMSPMDKGMKGYLVAGKWYYLTNSAINCVWWQNEEDAKEFLCHAGIGLHRTGVTIGTYSEVVNGG